ncbi:MAG: N-acetylmuramoyl-L-alanine amidase [Pyrinomonadaceae bacterium]
MIRVKSIKKSSGLLVGILVCGVFTAVTLINFTAISSAARKSSVKHQQTTSLLSEDAQKFNLWFEEAATEFSVPVELLQAIAFVESRWTQRVPDTSVPSESGMPPSYGIMGLRSDPYFGSSLSDAAALIGSSPEDLKLNPQNNIRGAAALLAYYHNKENSAGLESWEPAVAKLSGIPQPEIAQIQTYDIFNSINLGRRDNKNYRVTQHDVDLNLTYGSERLRLLSAPAITFSPESRTGTSGGIAPVETNSADYGPAIFNQAATCNFGSRNGTAITHVTIHVTQGSYAGTISFFKNCSAVVSAHYVIRSSDGQVTQMVREIDRAFHVGNSNSYTVGIEHEGFVDQPSFFTTAMYNASAALTRDICASHGIDRTKTLGMTFQGPLSDVDFKVKGHVNYANQTHTDPGVNWDWARYKRLVIGN